MYRTKLRLALNLLNAENTFAKPLNEKFEDRLPDKTVRRLRFTPFAVRKSYYSSGKEDTIPPHCNPCPPCKGPPCTPTCPPPPRPPQPKWCPPPSIARTDCPQPCEARKDTRSKKPKPRPAPVQKPLCKK